MWSWSWPAKDHFSRNDLDQRSDHFKRSLITWFRGVAGIMHGTFSRYDRNQDYVVRLIIIFPLPLQHNWPKDQRKRGSVGSELLDRWLTQWTNGTQGKGEGEIWNLRLGFGERKMPTERCKFVRAKLRESFCPAAASHSRDWPQPRPATPDWCLANSSNKFTPLCTELCKILFSVE